MGNVRGSDSGANPDVKIDPAVRVRQILLEFGEKSRDVIVFDSYQPFFGKAMKELLAMTGGTIPVCAWTETGEFWATECGKSFTLEAGTPEENQMGFCCYCGRKLESQAIPEENICSQCGGNGWVIVPAHAPDCSGECQNCPVMEQAPCDKCRGSGVIEVEK